MDEGKHRRLTERLPIDINVGMSCLNLYIEHRLGLFKAMKELLSDDGTVLISEEAVGDSLEKTKTFFSHLMNNFRALDCASQSLIFPDSTAIGTVMKPSTIKKLSKKVGFQILKYYPLKMYSVGFIN